MLKKLGNFIKKKEKEPKILNKVPKKPKFSLNPKVLLKNFLIWLRLRDDSGELLVKEDTYIDEIISHWVKSLILWLFGIIVTGLLIQIAILPFYSPPLKLIPFTIFSLGLLYYVIRDALIDLRDIIKTGGKNG